MFTQEHLQQNDISEQDLIKQIKTYRPDVNDQQISQLLSEIRANTPDITNMQVFYILADMFIEGQRKQAGVSQTSGRLGQLKQAMRK